MRKMLTIVSTILLFVLLVGCGDTLSDIKEAAYGINSAADKAATAISQDVHSIRAIEITYNDNTFTVNDLFKSILRDVQWHYEKIDDKDLLRITGTWQPHLFESYGLDTSKYKELDVYGDTTIQLYIQDQQILDEDTVVAIDYKEEQIFQQNGTEILHNMYQYYINK